MSKNLLLGETSAAVSNPLNLINPIKKIPLPNSVDLENLVIPELPSPVLKKFPKKSARIASDLRLGW